MATYIRSVDGKVQVEIEPGSPATLLPNISDQGLQAQIDTLRTEIRTYRGQPVVVNDSADMEDELTIYLYMGSEEGFNADHWYYYDGTEWVDGGEYVANPVLIDDTLTQSGEAADAKVTGDEISAIKADFNLITDSETETDYTAVSPVNTNTTNRVYYNTTYNKVGLLSGSNYAFKVFPVTLGNYRIKGFGNDTATSIMAIVGDADIVESGATTCNVVQTITVGSDAYTNHTINVEISSAGYLYVNYDTRSTESSCELITVTTELYVKTDDTLTDEHLPANAKAVGDAIGKDHGIIKNGDTYTYFKKYKDNYYTLQKIAKAGANNLYDYAGAYYGHLSNGSMVVDSTIWEYFTDQIGPISLRLSGETGFGWTGGNHKVTYNAAEYKTAKNGTITVKCNNEVITTDGIYHGDIDILITDELYAPNTITGDDLSSATKVVDETKHFILNDSFRVQVKVKFTENTDIALYYGMQHQIAHMNNIYLPTAGKDIVRTSLETGKLTESKEWHIILDNDNYQENMVLHQYGLGDWDKNNSATTAGRVACYATTKIYYVLCAGANITFAQGESMFWDGEYRLDRK